MCPVIVTLVNSVAHNAIFLRHMQTHLLSYSFVCELSICAFLVMIVGQFKTKMYLFVPYEQWGSTYHCELFLPTDEPTENLSVSAIPQAHFI